MRRRARTGEVDEAHPCVLGCQLLIDLFSGHCNGPWMSVMAKISTVVLVFMSRGGMIASRFV